MLACYGEMTATSPLHCLMVSGAEAFLVTFWWSDCSEMLPRPNGGGGWFFLYSMASDVRRGELLILGSKEGLMVSCLSSLRC